MTNEMTNKGNSEFEKSVDMMADVFLEEEKAAYHSEVESFEMYAERTRKQIHEGMDTFRDRFLKGYKILLDELDHQNIKVRDYEDKLPPYAIKL